MIIPLREVPRYERHLLFCSNLTPRRRSRRRRRASCPPTPTGQCAQPKLQATEDATPIPRAAGFDAAGTSVDVA